MGAEGFDIDESFEIQVFVKDKLSDNYSNPASFILGPGTPAVAIYKNNVAIGGRYDVDKTQYKMQVNGKASINNMPVSETLELNTYDDVEEGDYLQRSGLYTTQRLETYVWYHLINLRHRNGYGDGTQYGMQLRQPFDVTQSLELRNQHAGGWSDWHQIYKAKTLYDNPSGTNGSVELNDNVSGYKYLKIFYMRPNGMQNSVEVSNPEGASIKLTEIGSTYLYFAQVVASGKTITTNIYNRQILISDGSSTASDANLFHIIKVIGYR